MDPAAQRGHRPVCREKRDHIVKSRLVSGGKRKARAGIIAEFAVVAAHIVEGVVYRLEIVDRIVEKGHAAEILFPL